MAKILVIDDEPSVRAPLDMKLRHQGYDVLFADNGWKGLELYRQEHPDVIVLDLRMPELDGLAVLKEIRRVDLKQPVNILTGDTTPELERQVRRLGVNEFIIKRLLDEGPGGHTQVPSQIFYLGDRRLGYD